MKYKLTSNALSIALWDMKVIRGDCVDAVVSDLQEDEKEFLSKFGVKTIFMVPIFTNIVLLWILYF